MLSITLLSLVWLPRIGTMAEVAHDLGANSGLRGTIDLALSVDVAKTRDWALEVRTSNRTVIRENTRRETVVRVSPEQIYYRIGARARFRLSTQHDWAIFAHHQSNHDLDTNDAELNQETISYEIYGVELLSDTYRIGAGIYYDRGTRLSGRKQYWPFDYYLAGVQGRLEHALYHRWYSAFTAEVTVHRNENTQLPYTNLSGELDVGWHYQGREGDFRGFLRGARLSDYRFLADEPEHMILLGISICSRGHAL